MIYINNKEELIKYLQENITIYFNANFKDMILTINGTQFKFLVA